MLCALAIIAWSALTLTPAFLLLKAVGKMRVPREVEIRGLDIYKHGEAAYPLTAYGHGWDETAENTLTPSTRHALRSLGEQVDGKGLKWRGLFAFGICSDNGGVDTCQW